jgi:hypothetical protein
MEPLHSLVGHIGDGTACSEVTVRGYRDVPTSATAYRDERPRLRCSWPPLSLRLLAVPSSAGHGPPKSKIGRAGHNRGNLSGCACACACAGDERRPGPRSVGRSGRRTCIQVAAAGAPGPLAPGGYLLGVRPGPRPPPAQARTCQKAGQVSFNTTLYGCETATLHGGSRAVWVVPSLKLLPQKHHAVRLLGANGS